MLSAQRETRVHAVEKIDGLQRLIRAGRHPSLLSNRRRLFMATCPICGAEAETLDRTGDAEGFDCPRHGKFKVASSVLASEPTKNATRQDWEAAVCTENPIRIY
jgi:hypothetical protein